ncbi:proton-conducting transporter transmembrane domain-containing protein [Psychroflexus planctonicus]|uniref:NADH dehydrogenase n=1 Tax=Psychroflexus planctonicus TaxID=1526575 RepID=A0ABQ1SGM2_9FLAO|nr:proton-conducting transporter membrane subunit [Psychroflexus planctonicus]GGE31680.1 NADH dehydrogenase [Psychroflexus planctonicus]
MNSTLNIQQNTTPYLPQEIPWISRIINPLLWVLFTCSIVLIALYFTTDLDWTFGSYFRINGLSLSIFATVGFFGAIISTYAKNYLQGFKYQQLFSIYSLGFILSVLLFVSANHAALIVGSWFFMGLFMAKLIGVNSDWGEARAASNYALGFFTASSVLLGASLVLLSYYANTWFINSIFEQLNTIPSHIVLISALLLIVAGLIQSALFPFHRWLLSAMTAPTPASALMHAGFINGAGILFTLFASVLIASNTLTLLFVLGGFTAIIAQFVKLLQVNVKHKLACSTIAQMGFMVMQCGLGFFNAAIAHLILHGFYKAYLFLSSGEEIEMSTPKKPKKLKIQFIQAVLVGIFGLAGAALFMFLTGKDSFTNSSIFLTLVIAITVGQTTYNIVKEKSFSFIKRIFISAGLFIAGIVMYALMYNGVSLLLHELSFSVVPQKLTAIEISFGILFLVGFFLMKLGIYRKTPWLYVKLLNLTQPNKNTVLKFKS